MAGWRPATIPGDIRDEKAISSTERRNWDEPFRSEQEAAARAAIQLWDDLIAVEFREVAGNGSGRRRHRAGQQLGSGTGLCLSGRQLPGGWDGFLGDVFIADPAINPSNAQFEIGEYGNTTLIHELGHSLGLSHPGAYNFGQDFGRRREPDPLTYGEFAEYSQDSQQYSIMSYWGGWNTGGARSIGAIRGGRFTTAARKARCFTTSSPFSRSMVRIRPPVRVRPLTGFNSNAGNALYDFNQNPLPYYAVYDAGGMDTIDLSGFTASQYLNLTRARSARSAASR